MTSEQLIELIEKLRAASIKTKSANKTMNEPGLLNPVTAYFYEKTKKRTVRHRKNSFR
jgi:hypothetical protein